MSKTTFSTKLHKDARGKEQHYLILQNGFDEDVYVNIGKKTYDAGTTLILRGIEHQKNLELELNTPDENENKPEHDTATLEWNDDTDKNMEATETVLENRSSSNRHGHRGTTGSK